MPEPNDPREPDVTGELAASFPQHEIVRVLGRGGMGIVYLARHTRLDRLVALKLLSLERSNDFAARFEREARTLARLNHPNIVTLYDSGQTPDGRLYLVMEYVEGATLAELVAHRAANFDPRAIAVQVCDALAEAHAAGVVHRDIKPGNVLVDARGRVKVADFGLARLIGAEDSIVLTTAGKVMGTPGYMAPEQVRGETVDQRTDLFALGALIYEMLCRERPSGMFHPPSTRIGCDARWDAIVNRAMHADPAQRFASAAEMRAAIEALGTAPAALAAARPRKRGRVVAALVVLAALAVGAWFMWSRDEVQPRAVVSATPAPSPMPTPDPNAALIAATRSDVPAVKADASALTSVALREGEWTDLLPHVDPTRDSIRGSWEKTEQGLACTKPFPWSICSFPLHEPEGDYDLRFRVTRGEGSHLAMFFLFRKNGTGGYAPIDYIDASKPEFADGRRGAGIESLGPPMFRAGGIMARAQEWLPKGREATVLMQVRESEVRVTVDETEAFRWEADWSKIQQRGGVGSPLFATLPRQPFFGVGIYNCTAVFHSIGMRRGVATAASAEAPFVNSLGMKFVAVPITGGPTHGQRVRFSVWETRVQDYEVFAGETQRALRKTTFEQHLTHPVDTVTWDEAQAFCAWLTNRERNAGVIGTDDRYRLPRDHEWSCAVGIEGREDAARPPSEKDQKLVGVFPWGGTWPPPNGVGNFAGEELRAALAAGKHAFIQNVIVGFRDEHEITAPVGSYPASTLGLHDLSGNVWEWCEDWWDASQQERVLRGGSWYGRDPGSALSSARRRNAPGGYYGFRPVLEVAR